MPDMSYREEVAKDMKKFEEESEADSEYNADNMTEEQMAKEMGGVSGSKRFEERVKKAAEDKEKKSKFE